MSDYLPFLIFGLSVGAVYGLSAMGLVLTYKTSGLFNLGQGAVAAAGAFAFYDLRELQGLPWPVAALISVLVFGAFLGFLLERMARALAPVTTAYKIVATIGLLLAIRGIAVLRFGPEALTFQPFLPSKTVFTVADVPVGVDRLIYLGIGIASAVALFTFFNRSRLGTAMRAVVDDAPLLDMTGIDPARVRVSAWIIGSCFACASGVLFASAQQQLDVDILSLLVIQAFGAAAIGRFTNLPLSFVGGLAIGLLQAFASKAFSGTPSLQGIAPNIPFLVLFAILLFSNRERLVELGRDIKGRAVPDSPFPVRVRALGFAVLLAGALLVPQVVGSRLGFYMSAMASVVLFLSLGLLVRTSGQISLCHIGFAAIGAVGFANTVDGALPWGLAVLFGGLIAVPVGLLIAIPAIRLSGLFLALATLGFGILLAQYAYNRDYMFGIGLETQRPAGFDSDTRYYYLLLAFAIAAAVLVSVVERSRLGRLLQGMADSPVALTTLGTNVNISRVLVFCLSAFLAGISGAISASIFGSVNQDSYPFVASLSVLAILAISGRRLLTSAVVAAVLFEVLPGYVANDQANLYLNVAFGLTAVLVAAGSQGAYGQGLRSWVARQTDRTTSPVVARHHLEELPAPVPRLDLPGTEKDRPRAGVLR